MRKEKINEIFKKVSKRIKKQKELVLSLWDIPRKEHTKEWKAKLFLETGELDGWRYCRDLFRRELNKILKDEK
jgi:hypothetical protein